MFSLLNRKCFGLSLGVRYYASTVTKNKPVFDWNNRISAATKKGHLKDAHLLLQQMLNSKVKPNKYTYSILLSGYTHRGDVAGAERVWAEMARNGVKPDLVNYTTLLSAYTRRGDTAKSEALWQDILGSGLQPNAHTFTTLLSMYAKKGDVMQAERVWSELEGRGLPPNLYLYTTIISLYARAENSLKVEELWKKMALDGISPDLEVYTTLLTLYAKVGEVAKSEKILKEMEIGGFKLDLSVYCTLLSLYANTGNIELGRSIHCKLLQNDWNEEMGNRSFNYLTASLIMLYSSCGDVGNARKVFDSAMVKKGEHFDIAVWNAMINGYALHGYGKEALEIYEQLCAKGFSPNHLTFTSLLTALSHAILPEKALEYINIMTQFGLTPDIVQHTCVVDAFARGGKLEEAEKYIGSMSESNVITWLSLLGACRLHGDLERGERVAKEIFKRWPMNTAAYVLLGNIYASKGMHMERDLVRKNMEDLQLKKVPGMSWIYIDGKMNRFLVSDKNHPEIIKIRNKMNELYEEIKKAGFIPRTHYVLKDVKEEMLEKELCGHSEKLAIAYGLLKCSFNQKDITIYKNLRVCGDCHEATKWISKVIGKTIKLRDTQRWHNFSDGKCSCNDCW